MTSAVPFKDYGTMSAKIHLECIMMRLKNVVVSSKNSMYRRDGSASILWRILVLNDLHLSNFSCKMYRTNISFIYNVSTVNALKFQTQKFLTKGLHKQCRQRSDISFRHSLISAHTFCHSTNYSKKQVHKNKLKHEKVRNKVFEISGHFL